MTGLTIDELNRGDEATFVDMLGGVYEASPWVSERAWSERPFDSLEDLQEIMERTVQSAPREKKLELLRAHPDLGEKTEMTKESREEQASAGLDQLTPDQYRVFQRLNEQYRDSFGFPFIMAVRDETPSVIKDAMEERVAHSQSEEFQTALNEVHEIAKLRLEELVET